MDQLPVQLTQAVLPGSTLKLKDDKRAMLTLILGIVGIGLAAGGIIDHFVEFPELF